MLATLRRSRTMVVTVAAIILTALAITLASPARANTPSRQVFWNNADSQATIYVQFHLSTYTSNDGWWAYQNVPPGSWQGEVVGNMFYEPRAFHIGPGWCVDYGWDMQQSNGSYKWSGTRTTCGNSSGVWQPIFLEYDYTSNYYVHTKAWWRGY